MSLSFSTRSGSATFRAVVGPRSTARALARDLDAHATGGALDHPHRRLDRGRVQIGHLRLGDGPDLRLRERPDLVLVRRGRALLEAKLLADEIGRGRALRHEGVGAVL